MSSMVAEPAERRHRVISETRPKMLKADLRKAENGELKALGACLFRARSWLGWTLEQLAAELKRDARQVARWERGEERTQVDVVMGVPDLQQPFAAQLSKWSGAEVYMRADFRKVG